LTHDTDTQLTATPAHNIEVTFDYLNATHKGQVLEI